MEVPDRLIRVREVVGQEAATVGLREDPGVSPALPWCLTDLLGNRTEIEDVDHQQVDGLGTLHTDRPAEHVRAVQVDIADMLAESLLPSCASVHSRHSTRNS